MSDDLCHSCPRRGDCLIAADALPRAELRPALLAAVRAAVAAGRCG